MITRLAAWIARRILHDLPRVGICMRCGAVQVTQDAFCGRCRPNAPDHLPGGEKDHE